jgi:hypothetical protein
VRIIIGDGFNGIAKFPDTFHSYVFINCVIKFEEINRIIDLTSSSIEEKSFI